MLKDRAPLLAVGLALVLLPFVLTNIGLGVTSATEVVIFAIACMALNILVGHTGLVSFGHGAWFGRGVYFSLLTLALSAMLYVVAFRWTAVTGGEDGLGGITRPVYFGLSFESAQTYYMLVAA